MCCCDFLMRKTTAVFAGITTGIGLLAGTLYLIWWNEMNDVCTKLAYADARSQMVESNCSSIPVNDGLFVHLTCDVNLALLSVSDFGTGVTVNGSWAIKATTEEYQFKETTHSNTKDKTTYKCSCFDYGWFTSYQSIDPDATQCNGQNGLPYCPYVYAHNNPKYNGKDSVTGVGSYYSYADRILLGSNFEITHDQVHKISGGESSRVYPPVTVVDYTGWLWTRMFGYYLYSAKDYTYIGDRRISLTSTSSSMISVLGTQSYSSPTTFHSQQFGGSKHPYCDKKPILVFEAGDKTGVTMFRELKKELSKNTTSFRVLSLALLLISLMLIVCPVYVFAEVLPCIGSCISEFVFWLLCMCSCTVALAIWLIWTGICWFYYKPVAGPIAFSIGLGLIFMIFCARLCHWLRRRPRYWSPNYDEPLCEDPFVFSEEIIVPSLSSRNAGEQGSTRWNSTLNYSDEGR